MVQGGLGQVQFWQCGMWLDPAGSFLLGGNIIMPARPGCRVQVQHQQAHSEKLPPDNGRSRGVVSQQKYFLAPFPQSNCQNWQLSSTPLAAFLA